MSALAQRYHTMAVIPPVSINGDVLDHAISMLGVSEALPAIVRGSAGLPVSVVSKGALVVAPSNTRVLSKLRLRMRKTVKVTRKAAGQGSVASHVHEPRVYVVNPGLT